MLERLLDFFIARPSRLAALGELVFSTGALLIFAGLFGKVGTAGLSLMHGLGSQSRPEVALTELLPAWLSWLVPEGFVGFSAAAALIAAGLCMAQAGRQYDRIWRS